MQLLAAQAILQTGPFAPMGKNADFVAGEPDFISPIATTTSSHQEEKRKPGNLFADALKANSDMRMAQERLQAIEKLNETSAETQLRTMARRYLQHEFDTQRERLTQILNSLREPIRAQ